MEDSRFKSKLSNSKASALESLQNLLSFFSFTAPSLVEAPVTSSRSVRGTWGISKHKQKFGFNLLFQSTF